MWQRKHIEELIDDLTSEFLESYKESDSKEAVSDYGAYFMGLYYNGWYETKSLNKKDI